MNWKRNFVLFCLLFTGATGLIYEVTWQRYLANLLGSQAKASALILSIFLGGMCVGYVVFGQLSKHRSPIALLKIAGYVEILIGAWALVFPELYSWAFQLVPLIPQGALLSFLCEFLICVVLIGPPTICMGSTLPLLTPALSRSVDDSKTFHAKLYALNTGGAFLGCLLAGFFLIHWLGLPGTLLWSAPLNILAGVLFLLLSQTSLIDYGVEASSGPSDTGLSRKEIVIASCIAFLGGFYALCLQMVFMRLVGLSAGSSEFSFSMIVSCYILLLALGAWQLSSSRSERTQMLVPNQLMLLVGTLAVFLTIDFWPYASHVLRVLFVGVQPAMYLYYAVFSATLLLVLLLPVAAMGRTLPLLFGILAKRDRALGGLVGQLYAVNTFGCVLGASLGGYIALFYLNLEEVFRVCLVLILVTIPLSMWLQQELKTEGSSREAGKLRALIVPVLGILLLGGSSLALIPSWDLDRFGRGTFRRRTVQDTTFKGPEAFYRKFSSGDLISYSDGPNTSVAVFEYHKNDPAKHQLSLFVNGKSDGATKGGDAQTTKFLAHLPALFQRSSSSRAAVVGFGTGITAGSLTLYDEFEQVDVFEISSAVREASTLFDPFNNAATQSPKLNWVIDDAYRGLQRTEEKYALISSEPSNPWVSGVERLYTEDFFERAKGALAEDGVFAQWVQLYAISDKTLATVFRAFSKSFPVVRVFKSKGDMVILGGLKPDALDVRETVLQRYSRDPIQQDLSEVGVTSLVGLFGFEIPLHPEALRGGVPHTLLEPQLSFFAATDFFLSAKPSFAKLYEDPLSLPWMLLSIENLAGNQFLLSRFSEEADVNRFFLSWLDVVCGNSINMLPREEFIKVQAACVRVSIAASSAGLVPFPFGLNPDEVAALKFMFPGNEGAEVPDPQLLLRVFNRYYSAMLPLRLENFEDWVRACREPDSEIFESCWTSYFLSALQRGLLAQAKEVLAAARERELGSTSLFERMLEQAGRAKARKDELVAARQNIE